MDEEEEGEEVGLIQGKPKSKLEGLLELPKAQGNSIYDLSDGQQPFSRRKLMNSSIAKQKLKRSILEAAADITHEFHGPYLSRLLMTDYTQSLLDSSYPASAFESVKKGFLFHLNSTGHYLILREHLRHAVSQIIQQCGLMVSPSGFQNQHEFQNFLHDIYIYLSDQLHDCLKETVSSEIDQNNPACPLPSGLDKSFPEMSDPITNPEDLTHLHLLHFAEEAIFEGDLENCHRLHLQRICRNPADPLCWVDFASMWSQRGDDRMAEIAIREALKLDPKCIHALLLAGIIAARHRDERSLSLIGSALELRPLSPEIYTLLAAAHRLLGNEINSKYFSLKARVLHLMLIGRDPGKAEVELKNFNFALPQTPTNPAQPLNTNGIGIGTGAGTGTGIGTGDSARGNERAIEEEGASPKRLPTDAQSQKSGKGGKPRSRVKKISTVDPNLTTLKSGRKSKSKDKDKPKSGKKSKQKENEQTTATSNDPQQKERLDAIKDENDLFTRKQSVSAREALNTMGGTKVAKLSKEIVKPQYYDLPIEINEGNLHLMFLPPMNPSIQFTWDVTMGFNKGGSKVVIPISSSATVPGGGGGGGKQYSSQDSDKEMEEIYQAFVNNPPRVSKPQNEYEVLEENPGSSTTKENDKDGDGESPRKKSRKRSGRKSKDDNNAPPEESARSTKDKDKDKDKDKKTPRGKKGKNKQKQQQQQPGDGDQESEDLKSEKGDKNTNESGGSKNQSIRMWTTRQGSEYIWTAQLLLQLHAHDFMDGVLARELFYTEHRSIPFLYLLSMSLFNRKREGAALPFLEEAITYDPNNPYIWELKGHTQYALNEFEEAAQCYEKSIENAEPNHDMQLTYLRFGSLCTDNNQMKLAKMVLLKGVNLYPSLYMWLALGNISYRQESNFEEAEAAFAQANRLDNTNPIIWGQLALISLAQGNQALAEQCYKWAIRFGLKKGPLLDDIKALQEQQGFGDPSFPRVPHCIPHEYFLKRLGRQKPLDIYREALETPESQVRINRKDKMEETTRELELKRRIQNWKKKGIEPGRDDNERERQRDIEIDDEEEDEEEEWQSQNIKSWNPDQGIPFSGNRKSQDKR